MSPIRTTILTIQQAKSLSLEREDIGFWQSHKRNSAKLRTRHIRGQKTLLPSRDCVGAKQERCSAPLTMTKHLVSGPFFGRFKV